MKKPFVAKYLAAQSSQTVNKEGSNPHPKFTSEKKSIHRQNSKKPPCITNTSGSMPNLTRVEAEIHRILPELSPDKSLSQSVEMCDSVSLAGVSCTDGSKTRRNSGNSSRGGSPPKPKRTRKSSISSENYMGTPSKDTIISNNHSLKYVRSEEVESTELSKNQSGDYSRKPSFMK